MGTPKKTLERQIHAELGGDPDGADESGLNVELSSQQFERAYDLAKQWFTARKGYVVYRPVAIVPNQNDYLMKSDVQQVIDVVFAVPEDVAAFFTLGFFDLIPYGPQGLGGVNTGLADYASFAQLISFNDQRKRVFSVQPEWWYDQQTQVLHITNRVGNVGNFMMVQCKLGNFDPSTLNDKDDYIFSRYVRAKAKQIVGRIRSKYDSLPSAGGTVTLDGKDLIAEAKEEIETLDKEIFASQGPDPILKG